MAYAVTTRATLRARIQDKLVTNFWADAEVNALIDEGLRVWNVLTHYFRQSSSKTISASTRFYDLEANVAGHLALLGVSAAAYHLDLLNIDAKDAADPNWQNSSDGTTLDAIPLGLNLMALDPPPSGSFAVDIISLQTADLPASDGAYIQLGEEDISALIDYCVFVSTIKEGGQELQDVMPMFQNFLRQAAHHNAALANSQIYSKVLSIGQTAG